MVARTRRHSRHRIAAHGCGLGRRLTLARCGLAHRLKGFGCGKGADSEAEGMGGRRTPRECVRIAALMLGRCVTERKDGAWRIRPVAPMPENGTRLPWQPRRAPSWMGYGSRSWMAGSLIERLEPFRLARGGGARARLTAQWNRFERPRNAHRPCGGASGCPYSPDAGALRSGDTHAAVRDTDNYAIRVPSGAAAIIAKRPGRRFGAGMVRRLGLDPGFAHQIRLR